MNYIALQGGRNAPEWVAAMERNRWPQSSGMGGRNGAEYPITCRFGIMGQEYSENN